MDTSRLSALAYYATPGPLTQLEEHAAVVDDLPASLPTLVEVVQGMLLHMHWAERYGLRLTEERKEEANTRPVEQIVHHVLVMDDAPLTAARPLEKRVVSTCRDYAALLCALLRHHGIPAGARCGFGTYFLPDHFEDHWACHYWNDDEDRWAMVDAQLDPFQRKELGIAFDPRDVPPDQLIVAGRAWDVCRSGQADPDDFGLGSDSMHGLWYVQSQLVRDLAAMNKMELLCWDCWGLGNADPDEAPSADDLALLDCVAALTQAANESFAELHALYEHNQQLRVPPVIISYDGPEPRRADLSGAGETSS